MSVRESFEALHASPSDEGPPAFVRWRGLLSLSLCLLLGPVVALTNQELIYAVGMWACGRDHPWATHIVPILCLIVTIGAGLTAYRDWRSVGGGVEDEAAGVATRTRFVALMGMAINAFSSLVILTQWAGVFVFDPCMRI